MGSLASHRGGTGSSPGLIKWDLLWTKWRWGRFSPSTSVSPANLHSTKFSIITITRGRYNRPFSGRRSEWTQFGLHPPLCKLKGNVITQCGNRGRSQWPRRVRHEQLYKYKTNLILVLSKLNILLFSFLNCYCVREIMDDC
jgi:hypothetical protein